MNSEALKKAAELLGGSGHPGSEPMGNLQAAAALETLLKGAQGASILSQLTPSSLPRSAPVSSLLPPVPSEGLTSQTLLAIQAQLASVGATPPASLLGTGSTSSGLAPSLRGGSDMSTMQNLLAAQALTGSMASSVANSVTPEMQKWPLERLEKHANLLKQLKQPVPEPVAVLLADARRKEAKKTAKRLANRKSASSSRARKKAFVQEMTELNARLKRQAQILALLPDLVMTINVEGVITFSSAQVERVLHHRIEDIVGARLVDLVAPASRDRLNRLISQLVASEQIATRGVSAAVASEERNVNDSGSGMEQVSGSASNVESVPVGVAGESVSEAAVVSETTFPLSVVKVKAKDGSSDENDNSDNSASLPGSKGVSSLTQDSISTPRSPTASSAENVASDDAKDAAKAKKCKNTKELPSSDVSNSSSISTSAKKLEKANQNLEKNVWAHNKKMKKLGSHSYRDDVTGAIVTANNASARLSSLQHRSESSSSSEEDSGYRESNDSREETSSSASDSSEPKSRRKPIAPTCTICLLRKDKSYIWCEVTSSIRTVESIVDSTTTEVTSDDGKSNQNLALKAGLKSEEGSSPSEADVQLEKELLLCLRPIRDGGAKVEGEISFGLHKKKKTVRMDTAREAGSAKPLKKRPPEDDTRPLEGEPLSKKPAIALEENGDVMPADEEDSSKFPGKAMNDTHPCD